MNEFDREFIKEGGPGATPAVLRAVDFHPDIDGWFVGGKQRLKTVLAVTGLLLLAVSIAAYVLKAPVTPTLLLFLGGFALTLIALFLPLPILAYFHYDIPELNDPPEEAGPVNVGEHGTVHRGHTDVPAGDDGERPYVWIWLEPPVISACNYQWYQYVRPRFAIDGRDRDSNREFEAATGLRYRYGDWNPDYHVSEVLESDPGFRPDGLGLGEDKPGKPFRQYHVPGTHLPGSVTSALVGILDAPSFCVRTASHRSEAEEVIKARIPDEDETVVQAHQPPDRDVNIVFTVEVRSYLVCIDHEGGVSCISYLEWAYTNDIDIRLTWRQEGIEAGTQPRWRLYSELARCNAGFTFGDWHAC